VSLRVRDWFVVKLEICVLVKSMILKLGEHYSRANLFQPSETYDLGRCGRVSPC
jgi:hypothetical protein